MEISNKADVQVETWIRQGSIALEGLKTRNGVAFLGILDDGRPVGPYASLQEISCAVASSMRRAGETVGNIILQPPQGFLACEIYSAELDIEIGEDYGYRPVFVHEKSGKVIGLEPDVGVTNVGIGAAIQYLKDGVKHELEVAFSSGAFAISLESVAALKAALEPVPEQPRPARLKPR